MRHYLLAQLRRERLRHGALGLGIVVSAVSFVLLTGTTRTTDVRVRGLLRSNYRSAYDILVRPPSSVSKIERHEGLVRNNFLSGIFGGITFSQYRAIAHIPGVEVAAPIAILGYMVPSVAVPVSVTHLLTRAPNQLFRIRFSYVADDGLSRYPASSEYVFFTHEKLTPIEYQNTPTLGGPTIVSPGCETRFDQTAVHDSPRNPFATPPQLVCFSTKTPGYEGIRKTFTSLFGWSRSEVGTDTYASPPLLVAAIDPTQEARLVGLDRAVVSGRYLRELGRPSVDKAGHTLVPALASSLSDVGEKLDVEVERLEIPSRIDVRATLYSRRAYRAVTGLRATPAATSSYSMGQLYNRLLGQSAFQGDPRGTLFSGSNVVIRWQFSPVRYRTIGPNALSPIVTGSSVTEWRGLGFGPGGDSAPVESEDTQFRHLQAVTSTSNPDTYLIPEVVGRFDPRKLLGFNALSRVPLGAYYPPLLEPGGAATRRLLRGLPLLPTQNVGGYNQPPPFLLVNLNGLDAFVNSRFFPNVPRAEARAPISAIRVRVRGVSGLDPLSRERLSVIARTIRQQTGLEVDITAGSSPHTVRIALPAGKYGRPQLQLDEGWSEKGAFLSYLRALDRKDVALFALILVVCAFFLANNAFAATRVRRSELGTLRTLGWSRREILRAVLGELALVGVLAGGVGTAVAAVLVTLLKLSLPLPDVAFVFPIAVGLAALTGLLPALVASRTTPLASINPAVSSIKRIHHVRGLTTMAAVNLGRLPARTSMGGIGLALAAAALTTLVGIERSFQGTLVGTVLGRAISIEVRSADFAAIGLAIALAALSIADVLYLNLRERRAELVTLRTLGWSNREIRTLVGLEALMLGTLASALGGLVGGLVSGLVLHLPPAPIAVAALIATAAGTAATMLATVPPIARLRRLTPPVVLAAE